MAAAPTAISTPRSPMERNPPATWPRRHSRVDPDRVRLLLDLRRRLHLLYRQEPDRAVIPGRPIPSDAQYHLPALEQRHDRPRDSRASRRLDSRVSRFWWFITFALGLEFLIGTALEWHRLIYHDGLTIRTNLFGTTYYSLVGLHALHVTIGLLLILAGADSDYVRLHERAPRRADRCSLMVLALRRCGLGSSIPDRVRDRSMS